MEEEYDDVMDMLVPEQVQEWTKESNSVLKELFNIIFENKILDQKGFIIIHRNKKSPDIFPDNFEIIDIRNYGISKIFFLKLK